MQRRAHAHERSERAAAALEFALVLPLLLTLVFGAIDFGYMINRTTIVNNAAREGAREAIFNPDPVAIESRIRAVVPTLDQADLTVNLSCRRADTSPCPGIDFATEWEEGGAVIVEVVYEYDYMTPVPGAMGMGASRNLKSTVEMRIEGE